MRAWLLERSPLDSRAAAARARRVRCDGLEPKIARLWNSSPPPNATARQVPPSTLNILATGSRCVAASAAVHGAAAALISPRTPPTRASPRPHAACALLSHPPRVCAARRSCSSRAGPRGSGGAARMQLAACWRRCERSQPRVAGSGQRTGGSCALSGRQSAHMCANAPAPAGRQPTGAGGVVPWIN